MRRLSWVSIAYLGLLGCTAPEPRVDDTRLDDALRRYIEQRTAEAEAGCECYSLFLDLSSPDNGTFTTQEACLEALIPSAPIDEAVECMRSVLEGAGVDVDEGVDIMNCYIESTSSQTDCYVDNAGVCEPDACSSDVIKNDPCAGPLDWQETALLYSCV